MRLLIFLTAFVLMSAQTHITPLQEYAEYARWIPFFLFSFIFLIELAVTRRLKRRFHAFDGWMLAFLAIAFLSAVYSVSPSLTIQRATTLLLMYLTAFWGMWGYVNRRGEDGVVDMLLLAALLIFVAGLILLPIDGSAFLAGRFRGVLQSPNSLGLLAAILLPLALYRSFVRRTLQDHFLVGLLSLSLMLTGSRGGLLGSVIGGSCVLWKARSSMSRLIKVFTVFVIGLIILSLLDFNLLPVSLVERSVESNYVRQSTVSTGSGRTEAWDIALNTVIPERPALGHGFGTEDLLFAEYGWLPGDFVQHQGAYFHNAYIGLTAQLGLVGALIFFVPLLFFAGHQFLATWKNRQLNLSHALLGTLLAGLTTGFFESWIYSMGNAFAFPFWISFMLLLRRVSNKHTLRVPTKVRAVGAQPSFQHSLVRNQ